MIPLRGLVSDDLTFRLTKRLSDSRISQASKKKKKKKFSFLILRGLHRVELLTLYITKKKLFTFQISCIEYYHRYLIKEKMWYSG